MQSLNYHDLKKLEKTLIENVFVWLWGVVLEKPSDFFLAFATVIHRYCFYVIVDICMPKIWVVRLKTAVCIIYDSNASLLCLCKLQIPPQKPLSDGNSCKNLIYVFHLSMFSVKNFIAQYHTLSFPISQLKTVIDNITY